MGILLRNNIRAYQEGKAIDNTVINKNSPILLPMAKVKEKATGRGRYLLDYEKEHPYIPYKSDNEFIKKFQPEKKQALNLMKYNEWKRKRDNYADVMMIAEDRLNKLHDYEQKKTSGNLKWWDKKVSGVNMTSKQREELIKKQAQMQLAWKNKPIEEKIADVGLDVAINILPEIALLKYAKDAVRTRKFIKGTDELNEIKNINKIDNDNLLFRQLFKKITKETQEINNNKNIADFEAKQIKKRLKENELDPMIMEENRIHREFLNRYNQPVDDLPENFLELKKSTQSHILNQRKNLRNRVPFFMENKNASFEDASFLSNIISDIKKANMSNYIRGVTRSVKPGVKLRPGVKSVKLAEDLDVSDNGLKIMERYATEDNMPRIQGHRGKNNIGESNHLHGGLWTVPENETNYYSGSIFKIKNGKAMYRKDAKDFGDSPVAIEQKLILKNPEKSLGIKIPDYNIEKYKNYLSKKLNKDNITFKDSEAFLRSLGVDFTYYNGFGGTHEFHFLPGKLEKGETTYLYGTILGLPYYKYNKNNGDIIKK